MFLLISYTLQFNVQISTNYQKSFLLNSTIELRKDDGMDYFERIQNAIEFIEENLQEKLTITDISSQSYFSAFHFQRLFQAITGFSVQQYIRNRRLSEAASLLATTTQNILEIAINFQYGSQEAFTRAFVQYFGVTPAKYRKGANSILLQPKINFWIINWKENSYAATRNTAIT